MTPDHDIMCDRCSVARARFRIWISRWDPAHDLILCLHHFNEHEDFVIDQGYEVIDLDEELTPA